MTANKRTKTTVHRNSAARRPSLPVNFRDSLFLLLPAFDFRTRILSRKKSVKRFRSCGGPRSSKMAWHNTRETKRFAKKSAWSFQYMRRMLRHQFRFRQSASGKHLSCSILTAATNFSSKYHLTLLQAADYDLVWNSTVTTDGKPCFELISSIGTRVRVLLVPWL
jgi:hypothetical protein